MYTRTSKVILVAATALFASLVAFNNLTDYDSNFQFVRHVLMMDTTFPGNRAMWRAIDAPFFHHAGYVLIIATEVAVAVLCWFGSFRLLGAINDAERYNASKGPAIAGLTLGIVRNNFV